MLAGGTTPDGVRSALAHIRAGAELRPEPVAHSVVAYVLCATGPTAQADLRTEIDHWELDPADDVGVAGDAGAVAAGARRWAEAGAGTVVLQPAAGVDIEDFARFVGSEVKPLLAV